MTNTVDVFQLSGDGLKALQTLVQTKQVISISTYIDSELGPSALVQYTQ